MHLKSKDNSLLVLGLTAITFSRVMFAFFNDPEGPNLLIVIGMALFVYALSWAAYVNVPFTGLRRLLLVICIQIAIVVGIYFALH